MTAATASIWLKGADPVESSAMFKRCREAGMSLARSLAMGRVGGSKDGWAHRTTIAGRDMCTRTVSRATRQAEALGLIKTFFVAPPARGQKPGKEHRPPGSDRPLVSGFLHRWTQGWGEARKAVGASVIAATRAAERVAELVQRARFSTLVPRTPPAAPTRPPMSAERIAEHQASAERRKRHWTAAELEEAVAALPPWRPPDEPPDD